MTNADPNPADNKGQEEVMKITISPDLKGTVANKIGPQEPPTTYLNPDKPLATIPDLRVLYEAQVNLNPANKVEKHIMLLERLAGGCPQGLAVSECKDASGNPGSPVTDPGNLNTATGWAGIPNNCLNKEHMPRNMFADGVPLTCKEGEIKWRGAGTRARGGGGGGHMGGSGMDGAGHPNGTRLPLHAFCTL